MLKKLLFSSSIVLISAFSVFAQSLHTPEKGSVERTEILNALRAPVERELRQKIQFAVDHFNVQSNWAFLDGKPQTAAGGEPNYKGTEHQKAIDYGAFDNNFFALLKKTGGKWRVVKYQIGCTDVCYLTWAKDFRAPKAIFPTFD